jgi:hypothetical protein
MRLGATWRTSAWLPKKVNAKSKKKILAMVQRINVLNVTQGVSEDYLAAGMRIYNSNRIRMSGYQAQPTSQATSLLSALASRKLH